MRTVIHLLLRTVCGLRFKNSLSSRQLVQSIEKTKSIHGESDGDNVSVYILVS